MTDWLPIDTAPKDGTWVLLRGGEKAAWEDVPPMVVAFWDTSSSDPNYGAWAYAHWDGDWYSTYEGPTHWMPLPQSPETP